VKFVPSDANIEDLNRALKFETLFDERTAEIKYKVACFHQMKVKVFYPSMRIEIFGSLHKCYNSIAGIHAPNQTGPEHRKKGYNGNGFPYTRMRYTIDYICRRLGLNDQTCYISNLEIGLNIVHPYSDRKVLTNLMRHVGVAFHETQKNYFEAEHAQYIVKCYDKGRQYKLSKPTIRIELKYRKMEALNMPTFTTLNDLKNKQMLAAFCNRLTNKWLEVLMYDYTIRENELKPTDARKLPLFKNSSYWNEELNPKRLDRPKKDLTRIILNHSENIQDYFTKRIKSDWNQLQKNCVTIDRLFKGVKPWEMCNH